MSKWKKFKKIVGLYKQENMNKEELTQEEINEQTENKASQHQHNTFLDLFQNT